MKKNILVAGGLLTLTLVGASCSNSNNQSVINSSVNNSTVSGPIINMGAEEFSPKQLTITAGTTVNFINSDTKDHWPASNPHPLHTDYPGFDPKSAVKPGSSWSFVFNNSGTWAFHDHLNTQLKGVIIVTK